MTENDISELYEIFKEAETNIKLAELDGKIEGFSLPAIESKFSVVGAIITFLAACLAIYKFISG